MAAFYPNNPLYYNSSYGEKEIYDALHKLDNNYVIFYSTMWHSKNKNGDIIWGESDFTIFHKRKGILVIEVKSGKISYKNNCWYQTRIDNGKTHLMQNPLSQADKSKYKFIDIINNNIPFNEKCIVEKAVWFPSIINLDNISNLPMEYSKEIILTKDALNNPEYFLNKVFDYYNMESRFNLTNNSVQEIKNLLAPEFDLVVSSLSRKKEIDYAFLRLTDEQSKLLDYLEEQQIATIQGSAGTGKTLIAVEAAKRLSNNGDKVLFLCFNKFLCNSLKENNKINNVDFYNLHSYLTKYKSIFNSDDELLDILRNISSREFDYNHIIIDETQDFPEGSIKEFERIAKSIDGKLLIFYDKNQILYKDRYPEWVINAECKLILNKNCRNTFQIANTSNNILNLKTIQNDNCIVGDMPILNVYDNDNLIEKIVFTIHNLLQEGYTISDIVILTLKTEINSILSNYKKIGNYYITNEINRSDNEIFFTTSRKFKGLESNAIIVVDFDGTILNNTINKNNFYVATSRAKQKLVILINKNDIPFVASSITDINLSNSLGKISTKLKVRPINQ